MQIRYLVGVALGALSFIPVAVQAQQAPSPQPELGAGDTIVVTGTRRSDRSIANSPVPIDVIGASQLREQGYTETAKVLNQLVPSFNFPQPAITDGTDSLRPASLRGLSPDQTLVLINGKRRHVSALLNMNGSMGRGSAAVDMNAIPPLAIERIEVLRDGASSQYGSDAIAGVINVHLRKATGGRMQVSYGKYFTDVSGLREATGVVTQNGVPVPDTTAGAADVYQLTRGDKVNRKDGGSLTVAANYGIPLGDGGYLNLTGQYEDKDWTNRSGYDPRLQYFRGDPRELTANRLNHRYGDPAITDFNLFLNAGYDLSPDAELYMFGSYGKRKGEAAGYFRRPGDSRNRDWAAPTTNFVPFYADGFLPLIVTDIADYAFAGGVRGGLGDGWKYDLSAVYGKNRFDFGVADSWNASMGGQLSQKRFKAGGLRFSELTINADVQKTFDLGIGDGVSVALGGEHRRDRFQIVAGEPQSYQAGPFSRPPYNAPAGAQVFPGFQPSNAITASRQSWAGYGEVETDLSKQLTLQLAGRYEHFSDFGDTVNGKFAARYEPAKGIALRGSISSGFRAPSLHQQYYATSSTNNVNGTLVEIGTFPVSSPVSLALGAKPLKPEKALNWGAGLTLSAVPRLTITADYYNIRIKDRVVVTENLQGPAVVAILQRAGFNAITSARFFVNGIATRTEGLELVGSYRLPEWELGRMTLTAGYNYNKTSISERASLPTLPGITLFGRQESLRITDGQPRNKINAGLDWDYGMFGLTARTNRYGSVLVPGVDAARDQRLAAKWITDLELRAKPAKALELAIGANNLFDVYPDALRAGIVDGQNYGLNGYFAPFSTFSPFGFNGRYLYGRVSVNF